MARLLQGWRRTALLLPLTLLAVAPGCVTPDVLLLHPGAHEEERPCKILSYWDQHVRIAFNTESQRIPPEELPFLAGRVYFFGADAKRPLTPSGTLTVDFYDMSVPAGTEPPLLGRTVFGSADLQKMRSENLLGMGYTVLAYWGTYDPKYTRIKVQITFYPEKGGGQLFAEPAIVSLQSARVERGRRTDLPGLNSTPAAPGLFTPPPPTPLGR
jgi:hypothetical protein